MELFQELQMKVIFILLPPFYFSETFITFWELTSSFAFRAILKDKEINFLSYYTLVLPKAGITQHDHYFIQRSSFNWHLTDSKELSPPLENENMLLISTGQSISNDNSISNRKVKFCFKQWDNCLSFWSY
jgi:hypothetical protein